MLTLPWRESSRSRRESFISSRSRTRTSMATRETSHSKRGASTPFNETRARAASWTMNSLRQGSRQRRWQKGCITTLTVRREKEEVLNWSHSTAFAPPPQFANLSSIAGEPLEFPENAPNDPKNDEIPEEFTYEVREKMIHFFFRGGEPSNSLFYQYFVSLQDLSTLGDSVGTVKVGLSEEKLKGLRTIQYSSTDSEITEEK